VGRRQDRSQRGRQAAGYELVRWAEAGRSVGVQSDRPATHGRATGQLQDILEVSRSASAGGRDGFAVYRVRGRGTQTIKTATVPASRLPTVRWHGGGSHRGSRQGKILSSDIL